MRGKVAKRLRKEAYGTDEAPRFREYFHDDKTNSIVADNKRRFYKMVKGLYKKGLFDDFKRRLLRTGGRSLS